jgi:hypothetical protein
MVAELHRRWSRLREGQISPSQKLHQFLPNSSPSFLEIVTPAAFLTFSPSFLRCAVVLCAGLILRRRRLTSLFLQLDLIRTKVLFTALEFVVLHIVGYSESSGVDLSLLFFPFPLSISPLAVVGDIFAFGVYFLVGIKDFPGFVIKLDSSETMLFGFWPISCCEFDCLRQRILDMTDPANVILICSNLNCESLINGGPWSIDVLAGG